MGRSKLLRATLNALFIQLFTCKRLEVAKKLIVDIKLAIRQSKRKSGRLMYIRPQGKSSAN